MRNQGRRTRAIFPSKALAIFVVALAVAACSGGGGGGGSSFSAGNQEVGGFWAGTIASTTINGTFQLSGVVTETGELQFVSSDGGAVYTGTVQVNGDKVTGTLEAVNFAGLMPPAALPAGTITIDATVTSQGAITGTYTGANDSGSFDVTYDPAYESFSDLGKLASDWTSIGNLVFKAGIGGENDILAISVAADGTFTGGDTDGCTYNGSFAIIDTDYNAYDAQLDITDCGGLNGSYTGLASLANDAGLEDTLLLSAANAAVGIAINADRISSRSAAGIWTGTITSDLDLIPVSTTAIIAENGVARFAVIDGTQLAGTADVSGNFLDSMFDGFAADGDLFPDGTTFGSVLIRGLVDTAVSLALSYQGVGDTGSLSLAYDAVYENGSSFATVADDWSFDDGAGDTVDINIAANGDISGSDSDGCTYGGSVSLIDTNFNAYQVDLTLSGCADAGDFSGLAAVLDGAVAGDTLLIAVSNSVAEAALTGGLTRAAP
ncbi:MAG: hypothetical protein JSV45_07770 [Chromatiales bacterium]|nr:MAG: hypothetical protein JSV45_07770 [Chromatiales bacterium]